VGSAHPGLRCYCLFLPNLPISLNSFSTHCVLLILHRLIAVKGVGGSYLERIEFIWALGPNPQGPLVSTVNQWSYLPEESPAFRVGSTGQPQCLSRDGKSCATSRDGFNLRMCAGTFSTSLVNCSATDGANDPLHWCTKARGALGECWYMGDMAVQGLDTVMEWEGVCLRVMTCLASSLLPNLYVGPG